MGEIQLKRFQEQVSELLLRHRSILDILSKLDQSNASVHRTVIKSITECGCLKVNAEKQNYSAAMAPELLRKQMKSHIDGELCENCSDLVIGELGKNLFFITALCNVLKLDLDEVVKKESEKCNTLGFFNMS